MFSLNRNSYLQARCSFVNARIINRSVDLARQQPCLDSQDFQPPMNRLISQQPSMIPYGNYDVTRRPLAFGNWALPKLSRELHHHDPFVVLQAVLSISDLVHDPEKAYEAIRLGIPDRLADLLLEPLHPIRESTAIVLTTIAGFADGKEAIVKNNTILENLYIGLGDPQSFVRVQVATCIEMIARFWLTADYLVEYGFIQMIFDLIREELNEITNIHLETLKSLLYCDGKNIAIAKDVDGFNILMSLLKDKPDDIISKSLDCVMILTSIKKGKERAIEARLLEIMNKFLYSDDIEICTGAASVLMFCTVKTKAKHLAFEIDNLSDRLVHLCKNPMNSSLQLHCLKALTNISEHPKIRSHVKENYLATLQQLEVAKDNRESKRILLRVIECLPWDKEYN